MHSPSSSPNPDSPFKFVRLMATKRPSLRPQSSSSASSSSTSSLYASFSSPDEEEMATVETPSEKIPSAPKPVMPTQIHEDDEGGKDDGDEGEEEASDSNDEKNQPKLQQSVSAESSDSDSSDDSDSDSDSGSGSGSGSDSDSVDPDPDLGPSNAAAAPPLLQSRQALKRKRDADAVERSEQKRPFERLWGMDDEITLLNGLVEHRMVKGTVPVSSREMKSFHLFIRDYLPIKVTNNQLTDKIRRLRKKFETNVTRDKNGIGIRIGADNAHEKTLYEISKKIWHADGDDDDNEVNITAVRTRSQKSKERRKDSAEVKLQYPYLWETVTKLAGESPFGLAMMRSLKMLDDSKAKVMDDKLKNLTTVQIKLHLRMLDLHKKAMKLFLDLCD